jgi:hypothetical protein
VSPPTASAVGAPAGTSGLLRFSLPARVTFRVGSGGAGSARRPEAFPEDLESSVLAVLHHAGCTGTRPKVPQQRTTFLLGPSPRLRLSTLGRRGSSRSCPPSARRAHPLRILRFSRRPPRLRPGERPSSRQAALVRPLGVVPRESDAAFARRAPALSTVDTMNGTFSPPGEGAIDNGENGGPAERESSARYVQKPAGDQRRPA